MTGTVTSLFHKNMWRYRNRNRKWMSGQLSSAQTYFVWFLQFVSSRPLRNTHPCSRYQLFFLILVRKTHRGPAEGWVNFFWIVEEKINPHAYTEGLSKNYMQTDKIPTVDCVIRSWDTYTWCMYTAFRLKDINEIKWYLLGIHLSQKAFSLWHWQITNSSRVSVVCLLLEQFCLFNFFHSLFLMHE